jgi:predicted Zn-dependent peptidase
MPAQNLPVLSPDKAVKAGVLPNGTSYYIVTNPTVKGVADFALVQRTGTENIPDTSSCKALSVARDALTVLPRSGGRSVQDFFTSHGVTPGRDGFVKVKDNTTEFRFSNVLLSSPEVLDSALLVLLDMVDRVAVSDDPFLKKWYAPSDQAVLIAGDIDAASVAGKLKMMSYMTPSVPSSARKEYVWERSDTSRYMNIPASYQGLSSFTAVWSSSRTPVEYMNTVQPAIYELFLAELGMLAEEYIADGLRMRNIPVADISCGHRTSLQSSGDEAFSVSVSVAEKDFPAAVETIAQVMGSLDAGKADVRDLIRMKRICMDQAKEMAFTPTTENSDYIDRCVAAFVYNGSLSTLQATADFLAGRVLADTTELRLFNNISSALLDPEKNLEISYSHPMPEDVVRSVFSGSWDASVENGFHVPSDTLGNYPYFVYAGPKVKIRTEKTDHMSKGVEWTFSNGFKVVYRRMPTGGRLHYTLALNGGFGSIDNLEKGEGGYVSDYYMLGKIFGRPADDFVADLALNGMSLNVHTGLNATMISGSADEGDTDFLLTALLTSVNCWEMDEDAVRYYESCEPLRHAMRKGSSAEMVAKVNEIMCPDYRYVSYRMLERISPDLARKAEVFYEGIFKMTNDGVLILLGDVDPDVLKKKIIPYVAGFQVTDRAFRRPLVRYQPASGWSTYTVEGEKNSVDIALSVPMTLTADNFMAAEVAALVLKKMLSEALADSGMYLELSHECRIYPNERINLHISLNEISPDGFASDVVHSGPIDALAVVRSVLSGVGGVDVRNEDVEAFKTRIKSTLDLDMKEPFYWLNVISRRYIAGKDFTTNHDARIKSVTADKVKAILSRLNEGTRVEYIVSRR